MHAVVCCRIQQSLLADGCEQRRHSGVDYELIASVNHHGETPASGHYTAELISICQHQVLPDACCIVLQDTAELVGR